MSKFGFMILLAWSLHSSAQDQVAVTYLANEGVMIEAGGRRIIIDGFHRLYSIYAALPEKIRQQMERAEKPFDDIDLVLVSHLHRDHFHPETLGNHLKNSPATRLVSSDQIVESLEKEYQFFPDIRGQIKEITPEWKRRVKIDIPGMNIRVLGLRHSSPRFDWIQNLGHLIQLGGYTFLHVGDADMSRENFEPFKLPESRIDLAFIPYWFLLEREGRSIVDELIAPARIAAVHIPPGQAESVARQVATVYPDSLCFIKMMETHNLRKRSGRP